MVVFYPNIPVNFLKKNSSHHLKKKKFIGVSIAGIKKELLLPLKPLKLESLSCYKQIQTENKMGQQKPQIVAVVNIPAKEHFHKITLNSQKEKIHCHLDLANQSDNLLECKDAIVQAGLQGSYQNLLINL